LNESVRMEEFTVSKKSAVTQETPQGTVVIYPRYPAGHFGGLKLDSGIGRFAHYSSIIQKLDVFDKVASKDEGRVSLSLLDDTIVVGYLACWYPDPTERWSKLDKLMYEMGAVEVSRNFRKMRIAHVMVDLMISEEFFEEKITYMNGFSWHWDLDGNGLTKFEYSKMMLNFLKYWGFK